MPAYVKTVWATGDILTAAKLNNAENGIAAALPLDGSVVMTGGITNNQAAPGGGLFAAVDVFQQAGANKFRWALDSGGNLVLHRYSAGAWAAFATFPLAGGTVTGLDADTTDTFHAAAAATANMIPVLDANARLPGGITGSAASLWDSGTPGAASPILVRYNATSGILEYSRNAGGSWSPSGILESRVIAYAMFL